MLPLDVLPPEPEVQSLDLLLIILAALVVVALLIVLIQLIRRGRR